MVNNSHSHSTAITATGDWSVAVIAALLGGALGWRALSEGVAHRGARVYWVGRAAFLSIAVPVGMVVGALFLMCSGGRCFD